MSPETRARRLVARYRAEPDSSARTLLVTVFGDTIVPRGSPVWLGSLVQLLEPLGVNERLVRTSLNRLVREGLVQAERIGRRSYYAVAEGSRADFAAAERRIYHGQATAWDGKWTVVTAPSDVVAPATRTALVQRLRWLGFGSLSSGVLLSPVDHVADVGAIVSELDAGRGVAVFRAERADEQLGLTDEQLAHAGFDTGAVAGLYDAFVRRFGPLAEAGGEQLAGLDREVAFLVRTLVVDAFRRVVLREPELPRPLWPDDWVGNRARRVAGCIYRAVAPAADRHVTTVAEQPAGPLPAPAPSFRTRFAD